MLVREFKVDLASFNFIGKSMYFIICADWFAKSSTKSLAIPTRADFNSVNDQKNNTSKSNLALYTLLLCKIKAYLLNNGTWFPKGSIKY